VRRGEVLLDFDVLDEWEDELRRMNQPKEGKSGARYRYPEPFMRLLAYLHVLFHLSLTLWRGLGREEESDSRKGSGHYPIRV
jgi:hypothetical protein